jgi:phosphoglycolate phosphatase-like HAD superfamily hydrolase
MTRVDKFRHYYHEYLGKSLSKKEMADLCQRFSELVVDKVVAAPEINGADEFLQRWCGRLACFVISATPNEEIKEIVRRRGMEGYFKEIVGAPTDKQKNLEILLARYNLNSTRCCFFGDAESDYMAADTCGVDFIGIVPGDDAPLIRARPGVTWTKDFIGFEEKFDLVL